MPPKPRGRSKKVSTRMVAALDAMRSYGFSDQLIVSTVNGLLKVYGEEGWPFIEDSSYKVLLDVILEKLEKEEQGKGNTVEDNQKYGNSQEIMAVNNDETAATGTSSSASVSNCINTEAEAPASQTNEFLEAATLDTALPDGDNALFPAPKGESSWKDTSLDQNCLKKNANDSNGKDVRNSGGVQEMGSTGLPTPQPLNHRPPCRRRPCYGWISSDDEEVDPVQLTSAPLSAELARLLSGTGMRRARKRRWDVRPEDM